MATHTQKYTNDDESYESETYLRKLDIPSEGERKKFSKTAHPKKTTKRGNPELILFSLKYHAEKITRGTIHNVLPSFRVAATSKALSPNIEADPNTDAVS